MFLDVCAIELGTTEALVIFFFLPPTPAYLRHFLSVALGLAFSLSLLFYISLHLNSYTLGNNPDSISYRRKNDIYALKVGVRNLYRIFTEVLWKQRKKKLKVN